MFFPEHSRLSDNTALSVGIERLEHCGVRIVFLIDAQFEMFFYLPAYIMGTEMQCRLKDG